MAFIPGEAGLFRIKLFWDIEGAEALNVVYAFSSDPGANDLGTAAGYTAIAQAAVSNPGPDGKTILAVTSTACVLRDVSAEDAHLETGVIHLRPAGDPGLAASPPPTPGSAWVSKWLTGQRGRSQHGRTFWPALDDNLIQNNGSLTTDGLTFTNDAIAGFLEGMAATGPVSSNLGLVVASFFSGVDPVTHRPVPRAEGIHTAVTSGVVDLHMHSQRRRNLHG
jgi:hypothetical protein